MIYVDPAHPSFELLPREQQAMIYKSLNWTITAIADEFDVSRGAVRYWVDPEFRERQKRMSSIRRHYARERVTQ